MSNKYNAIVCEKTRYYKGVPYITKKDFNQKKNSIVVGKTKLKKYKSDCNNKNIDLLYFNDNVYEVKDKIFAFNKGYVCVGDNKYITLKKHIPFFFLFLFFLLFMIFVVWYNKNITSDINPITPPEIEVTPDSEKSNEEINKKQEIPNVYVPTKNKTEKAKGIKYFISFDPNEGVGTMETISCNGNELCKLPKNLIKKEGYDFIGWSLSKNNDEIYLDETEVFNLTTENNTNIILYAIWKIKSFDVQFINYDGSIIDKTKYNYGDKVIIPDNPKRLGYTFLQWDKDISEVKENLTFNALYNIENYEIFYELNGGIFNKDVHSTYTIEDNSFHIPSPVKKGYTFIGWTTKNNDTPIVNYEIKKGTIGNLKLIANYRPNSYKIVYNSLSEGKTVDTQVNYDESVKLRKNTFIKEGYVFKGWSTVPEGSVTYTDEQEICNLSNKDKDVINLYAVWEVIKLNVKYYDLFGVILKEEQVAYGNSSTPPEDPFIDGYTFVGWNPTINTIKSNTDYHAEYIKNEYVVKYDLNKGNKNDIKKINYNVESDSFTLPQPTREGYTFVGWTGDNGFTPELQLTIPKGTVGNKNYKANWNANLYKVSLNPNEGTVNPNYIDISYKSLYGIIPTPERKGYLFDGWYNGDSLIKEDTVVNSAFDHEIKANWKIIDYSINYDLNGGSISSQPTSYNVESDSFTLPQPTREGYTFVGWTGDNGLIPTVNVVIEKGTIGDKNYKENWKVIDYSINYDLNGGSISSQPTSYNVESDSFTLPQPTKKGYTFVGWTGTELSSTSKNVTINKGSIGNRKYVANWSVNYYTVNYYVQNSLWTTRSVAYNTTPENLNAQSALDIYHKFNYWEGWVDKMPTNTVNLYANITESYCMLMTGHGPYGNAQALLNVFKSAGWTGRIEEAPSAPGYYWVVTDYTLTRAQADIQRNYIANHTNYTNYNFPYLYWVGLSCTNGIGDTWTRSVGTKNFTSQW